MNGIFCIPLPGRLRVPDGGLDRACQRRLALRGFFAGPENQLAEVGIQAAWPAKPRRYHPLVLFGPSGVGKSHLALGLAAAWRRRDPKVLVSCHNASDYSREVAASIENRSLSDMRCRYEAAEFVVIEDLEHLEHKDTAQRELAQLVDALDRRGTQMVVTSHRRPTAMPRLMPRLRSRLAAGLVVAVSPPGLAARLEIVKQLAALRGIALTAEAAKLLAEKLVGGVWQLHSAIQQLQVTADSDVTLNRDGVARFLALQVPPAGPTISDITLATARYFDLQVSELQSASRRRVLVQARGLAMLLARNLAGQSLEAVGRYFGGRDHTTVLHACRLTTKRLQGGSHLLHAADTIRKTLAACQQQRRKPVHRPSPHSAPAAKHG